jgi:hypothetical protein
MIGGSHADGLPGCSWLLGAYWERRENAKHYERTAQSDMHDSSFPEKMVVLLRHSGFTTLQPLYRPYIDLYLGNPHPPLSSLSHGNFRDREVELLIFLGLMEAKWPIR